ncbi:DNA polymerase IV [Pilimelia terevasa]|uniref:DNA polymerase IV n=1 Tax=Pilimelia terevasa TaxID=53372 RepID=A0A8J3BN11_9ACTN|nr:DNA polymerase IV [Pilimelia terevasa]GGK26124.1 DNA polymerase IV [Pilimelia terevasa]
MVVESESGAARCGVLHVDMDAFFAAVEVRRRPELRGRPVIVGGLGPRGVVASASYPARRFGVRSAMPVGEARRRCAPLVCVPPDYAAYRAASHAVMEIFRAVTPLVEPLSLDEAFLDVRGAVRLFGEPARIAADIRARVADELGLTCSVGVAPTKFVAKVASARAKPDGVLVVPAGRVLDFLHPLPVRALWGVGERAAQALRRHGLHRVGDLAAAPPALLRQAVGRAAAAHLAELARGRDPRPVTPERAGRSVSAETTFDTDIGGDAAVHRVLLDLARRVGERLRAGGHAGRTVAIKVRLPDFTTLSRSRTLPYPTDVGREIYTAAVDLWGALRAGGRPPVHRVRLLGVRVEGLVTAADAARQPELGAAVHGWAEAERAADAVSARFGRSVVSPASLLPRGGETSAENPYSPSVVPLSDRSSPS